MCQEWLRNIEHLRKRRAKFVSLEMVIFACREAKKKAGLPYLRVKGKNDARGGVDKTPQ